MRPPDSAGAPGLLGGEAVALGWPPSYTLATCLSTLGPSRAFPASPWFFLLSVSSDLV